MMMYTPHDWYWVVGGDESRAWSSKDAAYVDRWPPGRVTRIASEQELNEVLEGVGLRGPLVTAAHVKAEARRRILARFPEWKQANMTARGVELQDIWRRNGAWAAEEQAEADALQGAWTWIKTVRVASDQLEGTLAADYKSDVNWPGY